MTVFHLWKRRRGVAAGGAHISDAFSDLPTHGVVHVIATASLLLLIMTATAALAVHTWSDSAVMRLHRPD
jgi:hypothetical protein